MTFCYKYQIARCPVVLLGIALYKRLHPSGVPTLPIFRCQLLSFLHCPVQTYTIIGLFTDLFKQEGLACVRCLCPQDDVGEISHFCF